jgi:heterodisulfide reductase subunit A
MGAMNKVMNGKVAVVGAGVAGIAAATVLRKLGIETDVFEKEESPGGHLKKWHALFPGRNEAPAVLEGLLKDIESNGLSLRLNSEVTGMTRENGAFRIMTSNGADTAYTAVVVAGGFTLFDASRKEEYGYGIYPRVITSPDLEHRFNDGGEGLLIQGKHPGRVAFVHCVGSRDAKVGNHYCSRVCCITGVKQAIAVKEAYPGCEVINFYMDLRMFGSGYEELYQEAQEKYGITFIRGRVSEAAQNMNGTVVLKAEDTLLGRPLKVTADWLVLLVGMEPDTGTGRLANGVGVGYDQAGFLEGNDKFLKPGVTSAEGVFIAGACGGPASIPEAVNQGRSAAFSVLRYLNGKING